MAYDESKLIEIEDLGFSYDGDTKVLSKLNLSVPKGKITVLMGPNGCGKSTLFRLITKDLYPDKGVIRLEGRDIEDFGRKEFARRVAIVHQHQSAPVDITVERLVSYGRTPHLDILQSANSKKDHSAIEAAMEATGIVSIRDKIVSELSGGQRQRVWIAMALCQETEILLLDEPTTYLDIRYQLEILHLVRTLNTEMNKTVVMVLHDINQAMSYGDLFVGMKDGNIAVCGEAKEVVTEELLYKLYDVRLPILSTNGKRFVYVV